MRALTCYPHWAHSIAWLGKRIENRTRPIPAALVGQRVAIHAGATLDEVRDARVIGDALRAGPRWALDLAAYPHVLLDGPFVGRKGFDPRWRIPTTRAIVAVATLCEPFVSAADWRADGARLDELPPWADPHARYWWALSEVRPLAEPVPVRRGQLGLWRLDLETDAAVRREEERCSAAP